MRRPNIERSFRYPPYSHFAFSRNCPRKCGSLFVASPPPGYVPGGGGSEFTGEGVLGDTTKSEKSKLKAIRGERLKIVRYKMAEKKRRFLMYTRVGTATIFSHFQPHITSAGNMLWRLLPQQVFVGFYENFGEML